MVGYRHSRAVSARVVANERMRLKLERDALARQKPLSAAVSKQWQDLKTERNFPWNSVFGVIEATASKNIELLEFAPPDQIWSGSSANCKVYAISLKP